MKGGHRVCVVGGGLAGIAAAIDLVDAGATVTLIEARPRLGGATYSFRRGDLSVDTGQHVFLRCFAEYRRLLTRLGSTDRASLQDAFAVPVLRAGAPPFMLARSRYLPAPAHLLPALARYPLLGPAQRLRAIRAAATLRRVDPDGPGTDDVSFGTWLADHGQDVTAIRRLWELICVAALNSQADGASLALAARVFRTGLLDAADAADIGRPVAPLRELHGDPALATLTAAGAQVRRGARVRAIRFERGEFHLDTGSAELAADAVVLAVPHQQAARLVPDAAVPDRAHWRLLGAVPIINVHIVYGQRVTDLQFAAAAESPVQWLFDRTPAGLPGQYLVASISAAEAELCVPSRTLAALYLDAMAELFPAARHAEVRDVFVTREPRATFRQAPGTRAHRPAARTGLPAFVLAGAWTDTGWPDTMEGAVRSGRRAAALVLNHFGSRDHRRSRAGTTEVVS